MVRPLTADDLDQVCDVLENSAHIRMKYPKEGVSRQYVTGLWRGLLMEGRSMAFVSVEPDGSMNGFILAIRGGDPFSGKPVAFEELWYCIPTRSKESLALLRALLEESKKQKCVRVLSGDWQPNGGVDLSRIYARNGFKPLERFFVKEL